MIITVGIAVNSCIVLENLIISTASTVWNDSDTWNDSSTWNE